MIVLGIDPGASGALAWCHSSGALIGVADMPMVEVRGKRRVSASMLAKLMKARECHMIVIEGVSAMPRKIKGKDGQDEEVKMGAASSFSFGYSAGLLEGVAAAMDLPVQIIAARSWKRMAGVPKDKGAVREMAQRQWPASASRFARVKDAGRAEAALLARMVAIGNGSAVHVPSLVEREQPALDAVA